MGDNRHCWENGVGKTTFHEGYNWSPAIFRKDFYNEKELSKFSEKDFEKFIGYFPQEIAFFPTSIAKNISCLKEPDSKRIVEVAKLIGIHELILKLPYGYETFLDGGFSFLSGGKGKN